MTPHEIAAGVKPSERQVNWQKTEFYGFINFGLATVLNREWTDGGVNPVNFNPEEFDAQEWVQFFKDAGLAFYMRYDLSLPVEENIKANIAWLEEKHKGFKVK